MTSPPRTGLFFLTAALLTACGGRSQLRDSGSVGVGGSGGAGPSTTTVSVSSAGGFGGAGGFVDVGGSGGMLAGCVVDGAPIGLAGTQGYVTSDPVFVTPIQVDSTTLVAAWQANEGPSTPPIELRHTSFQPWGPWPADATLGPSYLATYDGGQGFYAAPSQTDFSLVFASPSPGTGLIYLSHLTPGKGFAGVAEALIGGPAQPLFLERGTDPQVHLLGSFTSSAGVHVFNTLHRNDTGPGEFFAFGLGCALDPIAAGAAPFGEDFFVAFASGSGFDDPGCATGAGITTANRLQLARVTKDGNVTWLQEIKGNGGGETITTVKVVPRLDGAWVAWTGSFKGPMLHVVRLDSLGQPTGAQFGVPFFGDVSSLSATSLGDRLALAWSGSAADAPSQIRINLLSTFGNLDADLSINLGPSAMGRTALLGSPSNKGLLVAWSEEALLGPQIRMARLACSLP
ncbi:MAG: hypothetical protein ABJE95_03600 [Byssovorax sp.]